VFIEAKDDGSGGDIWSHKSCKASVKSSPPTNHHQPTARIMYLFDLDDKIRIIHTYNTYKIPCVTKTPWEVEHLHRSRLH